jgi:hypothetical protein
MPEVTKVLEEFPGFAVRYDQTTRPLFRAIVKETLRRLTTVAIGNELLGAIAAARPHSRADFLPGVNVLCIPTRINVTQSGYRREVLDDVDGTEKITGMTPTTLPKFSPPRCRFWHAGGSSNEAVDQTAGSNATGTVCLMRFSNAPVVTDKGESTHAFIVLAHELIHSLHALQGVTIESGDEELWTTGLGRYARERMTENAFRHQFGIVLRKHYF